MVGAVRGRKFGRWVSKIGVERATDRRVKRSGEAGLLPPAPSPLYPNALCSPAPSPLYPNALRSAEAGANEDLPKFVADQSGIPVSASLVVAWDTGRIMRLSVSGMDHVSAMGLLLADPNWSGRRTME